jgi:hypothetical protein
MSPFQIIYRITLPERMDSDRFIKFMQDEYFPAVHTGPTRVGQVTSLTLFRDVSETDEGRNRFFLHVAYSGLAMGDVIVENEEVRQTFENVYGAERLGVFDEVATWSKENGS